MVTLRQASTLAAILIATGVALAGAQNPQEIVRRSVDAIKEDWAQAPKYSYIERDVDSKRDGPRMSKTYRVLMIDGSPYNLVTAINDEPLPVDQRAVEQHKLQKEIIRRRNESQREREKRMARYDRELQRNHDMLREMVDAFQFRLTGDAQVNGRNCWVLNAEPKPGYQPSDHEGHVLKGMQGKLWIDKQTYQWVKVRAEVVRPVTFYGFLAKVGPGTEFYLEQEPVANGLWFPKVFDVRVKATALGLFSENSTEYDTYRDYQPMPQAMALLQSTK
jgi:hypothetical protein